MSNQLRLKGKFIKQNQLERKKKCAEGLKRAREEVRNKKDDSESSFPAKGRRLVGIEFLSKQLKCDKCFEHLRLENMQKEQIRGVHYTFFITCTACLAVNRVESGKVHYVNESASKAAKHKKKVRHNDTTTKVVLGNDLLTNLIKNFLII